MWTNPTSTIPSPSCAGCAPATKSTTTSCYDDEALVQAVKLSHRYVTDRRLPDKAIDLIDEAAAKLRVAFYSMPDRLKQMKLELDKLVACGGTGVGQPRLRSGRPGQDAARQAGIPVSRGSAASGTTMPTWTRSWTPTTSPTSSARGPVSPSRACWRPSPRSCCTWKTACASASSARSAPWRLSATPSAAHAAV